MLVNLRIEPAELKKLGILNKRMELPEQEKLNYLALKKGYEGEVLFDSFTEKLKLDCLILNNLLLKVNNTLFQIDTLIITQNTIYFFEVKNFEGDFIYEKDRLYTISNSEIKDPLLQLKRSQSLLRQLLQKLGYSFPIDSWVVFINPEFSLYQASPNDPIILPTQLERFLKKLDNIPSKLDQTHKKLAEQLLSLNIKDSPYSRSITYEYPQLKKIIICMVCGSYLSSRKGKKCICENCHHEEEFKSAVLRSVEEFRILFPEQKITTPIIHEWCGGIVSAKTISRILKSNLRVIGTRHFTYYE